MPERLSELAWRMRPYMLSVSGSAAAFQLGRIMLYQAGVAVTFYDATNAGLSAALATAASGDSVVLPACDITGTSWTVGAGIELLGQWQASILRGTLGIDGGHARAVTVYGQVQINNSGTLIDAWVFHSGTTDGVVCGNNGASLYRVYIEGDGNSNGLNCTPGASNFQGYRFFEVFTTFTGTPAGHTGVSVDAGDASFYGCRFQGYSTGGYVNTCKDFSACYFETSLLGTGVALRHDNGTARLYGCFFYCAGGAAVCYQAGTGNVYMSGCGWANGTVGTIDYDQGDRGAYAVESYHAADIEAGTLTRHLPAPSGSGKIAIDSGTAWAAHALSGDATMTSAGVITVANGAITPAKTGGFTPGQVIYAGSGSALSGSAGMVFDGYQLALPTSGSVGGVLLGGDVQIYRSAANVMTTPDAIYSTANINTVGAPGTANFGMRNASEVLRWAFISNTTESGSDTGFNFTFVSRTDAGASKSTHMQFVRDTGVTQINPVSKAATIIGGTSVPSGSAAPTLVIAVSSGSGASVVNAAGLYTFGANAELFAFDEAGNITQLTKHADPDDWAELAVPDEDPFPQVSLEHNLYLGVTAATYRHHITGKQTRVVRHWPASARRDWDADQARAVVEREKEIAQWDEALEKEGTRPQPYTPKQMPGWMRRRL